MYLPQDIKYIITIDSLQAWMVPSGDLHKLDSAGLDSNSEFIILSSRFSGTRLT